MSLGFLGIYFSALSLGVLGLQGKLGFLYTHRKKKSNL